VIQRALDAEALAVALVLDPATFSRNRFYDLYDDPAVRRVRRRAALLRGLVKQLATALHRSGDLSVASRAKDAMEELSFEISSLGLSRRTILDPTEGALLRFSLERSMGGPRRDAIPPELSLRTEDRDRIHQALRRLAVSEGADPATLSSW
jgi:hypothetical protein